MSITYRSSKLFDKPSTTTAAHIKIDQILSSHKKKLRINSRSNCQPQVQHTERLNAKQAKTIENLASKTRQHSLNTLLKSYNQGLENIEKRYSAGFQRNTELSNFLNQERLKMFRSGVNYRSTSRARGAHVTPLDKESIKEYFKRVPLEEKNPEKKQQPLRRYQTIDLGHKTNQWFDTISTTLGSKPKKSQSYISAP